MESIPLLNEIEDGVLLDKRYPVNDRRLVENEMDKPMGDLDIVRSLSEEKMQLNNYDDGVVLDKTDKGIQNRGNNNEMSLFEKHIDISKEENVDIQTYNKHDGTSPCLDDNDIVIPLDKSKIGILMHDNNQGGSLHDVAAPIDHKKNFVIDMPGDSKSKSNHRSMVDEDDDDSTAPESTECSQDEYSDDVASTDDGIASRNIDGPFVKRNDNRNSCSCINEAVDIETASEFSKEKVKIVCDKCNKPDCNKTSCDHSQNEDNVMQYAEILYKCTLCTSLPSILTSKNAFISHVIKEHLSRYEGCVSCIECHLYFGTDGDLHAHSKHTHPEHQMSVLEKTSHENESLLVNNEDVALKRIQTVYPLKHEHFNISKKRERTAHAGITKRNIVKTSTGMKCDSPLGVKQFLMTNAKIILNHTLVSTNSHLKDLLAAQKDSSNKKAKASHFWLTPSFTPEFGKYTKLVREGGNIVYFCQVCNWKSQVKAPFQVHCNGKLHRSKVDAANVNELANPDAPVNIADNKLDNQQKLKHLNKHGLDKSIMFHNSAAEYLDHSKNVFVDIERNKLFQNSSLLKQEKTVPQKQEIVRNRRKRSAPVPLRNFVDEKCRWSDSDSDNSEHDESTSCHVGITSETRRKVYNSFKRCRNLESNDLATAENQLTSFKDNATKLSANSGVSPTSMKNDVKENTQNSQMHKPDHRLLEDAYKSISPNNDRHKETNMSSVNDSVETRGWNVKQEPIDDDDRRVYQCPRCRFSCVGVTNYGIHFEVCYASKGGNSTTAVERDAKTSTHAEGWKTSKIQQMLPGKCYLIFTYIYLYFMIISQLVDW